MLSAVRAFVLGTLLASAAVACSAAPVEESDDGSAALDVGPAAKAVLLLPFQYREDGRITPDEYAFADGAKQLEAFYEEGGATVVRPTGSELTGDPESLFTYLRKLAGGKVRFDRIILLAHGGVDGPIWGDNYGQIGFDWPAPYPYDVSTEAFVRDANESFANNHAKLAELGRLMHDVTTDHAVIYLGQCNPGQPTTWNSGGKTFVEAFACATGRKTAGRIHKTSAADAVAVVKRLERKDVPKASNFAFANDGAEKCTSLPPPVPFTLDPSTAAEQFEDEEDGAADPQP